ncbi:MAG: CpXC domain-containing protein, partial [Thermoplasmata archaeon]
GESFSAKLYDIINAQKNPELKKELIEGKINVVICPKCKKRLFIDKILLFHDPSKELMVQLFPKRFRENETVIREELEKTINEKVENGNLLTDAPVIPNYMRRPRIAFSIEELATIIKEYDKNEK